MHTPKLLASLAMLSLLASQSSAQLLDWLPVQDLPLTGNEIGGGPIMPAAAAMCMWDPDGDGPKPRCVVVAGSLNLPAIGGNQDLAYLDADGWVGLRTPGGAYSIAAYAAHGESRESLYYATGTRQYCRVGESWALFGNILSSKTMSVWDLDGAGPQPAKLLIGGAAGVFTYDGTSLGQLGASGSPTNIYSLIMWDVDGSGPLVPRLLAAGLSGIHQWDGSQWTLFAASAGSVQSLCSFDFDGDGPNPPELVATGQFTSLGGTGGPGISVLRNDVWNFFGYQHATGNYIARSLSYDPDGAGPMSPRLVVAGRFSVIDGVAVPNLAYYNEGAWHAFPEYWNAVSVCIGINAEAGYSDSPQLVVAALSGVRPAFGIIALCDEEPGYRNDPAGGRRPQGETLSIGVIPTGDELSFQWFKENMPLVSGTTASGSVISGTASPRLTISGLTPQDEAEYHLAIGNAFGVVTTQPASVSLGCAADFNADDVVDFPDYIDFITAFVNGEPVSDFNNDMEIDLFDYLDFVQHFADGC